MTAREELVGELHFPSGKPQNVKFVQNKRPNLTKAEGDAGLTWIDNRYAEGDVRRYGYKADDSTDNWTAIDTALTVAAESEGKSVYIPQGPGRTSDRHVLTAARSGVRIYGEGYNSVLKLTGTHTTNKCVFIIPANGDNDGGTVDGADNVTIENIQFDGSLATMTTGVSSAIRCFHGDGHIFRNLWIHDFELSGLLIQGIGASAEISAIVDSVYSYENDDGTSTGQGIGIESANDDATRITLNNVHCYNNGGTNYGRGINVGSGSCTISNAWCWGNGAGGIKTSGNDNQHVVLNNVHCNDNAGTTAQGFTTTGTYRLVEFNNCIFDNNGDHGLEIGHAGAVVINNVYCRGNADIGLLVDGDADVSISNAVAESSTNQGMRFASACNVQAASLRTKSNGRFGVQIVTTGVCHIDSIISVDDCTAGTDSDAISVQPASAGLDLKIGAINASDASTNVTTALDLVNSNISRAFIGKITLDSITNAISDSGTNTIRYDDLVGSTTWDPPSIADGNEAATDVTVTGAILGDYAIASISRDVQDLVLSATVTTADTVTVVLANNTGAAIDLGSSTVRARVIKR